MPSQTSPIDGSLSFPQFIDTFLHKDPNEVYAILTPPTENGDLVNVTWLDFVRAIHRSAHVVNPIVDGKLRIGAGNVIGIYAVTDTLLYATLILAVIRSGNIPMPISNRNSAPAIANLISNTSCHHIIRAGGSTTDQVAKDVRLSLDDQHHEINITFLPSVGSLFPRLWGENHTDTFEMYPDVEYHSQDKPAMYIHSSGSTGFPKPIPLTQRFIFQMMNLPSTKDFGGSVIMASMASPPFHMMGFWSQTLFPMATGSKIVLWAPASPPPVPTPESVMASMRIAKCTAALVVPTFLVSWARDAEAVKFLATMKIVTYGGGPLPQEVGDFLVQSGVPLVAVYGGTEFAFPARLTSNSRELTEWNWFEFAPQLNLRLIAQSNENGAHELHILDSQALSPMIHNIQSDEGPGYATSDLFIKHPTKDLWKIVGRLDDQITLSNGEKINPGPVEDIVIQNPLVDRVVLFGRAKDQPGLLIEPSPHHAFDPTNEKALAEYRNKIWPSIETANRASAAFARVFKEYILVAHPSKPIPRTPKGTVIRKQAYKLYKDEINEIYAAANVGNDVTPPTNWTESDLRVWLHNSAKDLIGGDVQDAVDLFEQGADSLTSAYLRNRIISVMRRSESVEIQGAIQRVESDIVFAHPTIIALAAHIVRLIRSPQGSTTPNPSTVLEMVAMVERYTASLPSRPCAKQTVLLTGSTGALGSHLLAQMLESDRVERVWAVNRHSKGKSISERQKESFIDKGLDVELLKLTGTKLVFVEATLSEDMLGLDKHLYRQISSTTTLIIHNAWRLDFNLSLTSYEPHIKGTRNLVDLALQSPIAAHVRIFFTSSIATLYSWKGEGSAPEEHINSPDISVSMGYGESKYVAEQILVEASNRTNISTTTFRVGQLCGGGNGSWSQTDWVPILLASSIHLGCLPDAIGNISWLPLDVAARGILDVGISNINPADMTLHLCHTRPVPWTTIMNAMSQSLKPVTGGTRLPLVPFHDWFTKLEKVALNATPGNMLRFPGIKILPFYRAMAEADRSNREVGLARANREAVGQVDLDTRKVQRASKTMRTIPSLDAEDAARWVDYWRSKGVFGGPEGRT